MTRTVRVLLCLDDDEPAEVATVDLADEHGGESLRRVSEELRRIADRLDERRTFGQIVRDGWGDAAVMNPTDESGEEA